MKGQMSHLDWALAGVTPLPLKNIEGFKSHPQNQKKDP